MLIPFIIALFLGIIAGTFTGLIPGIHINLIAIIILSISSTILKTTNPLILSIFIISMAITHTFLDFIPSIFLGAPDEDSVLSILPGHQLLLKGRGYYAVIFTLYGSLISLLIILILTPLFILTLPAIYPAILKLMPIILILISTHLILSEKQKIQTLFIFLFAGLLGLITLNLNLSQPLLPLLTGLFGASNLIISINQNTKIPIQKISKLTHIRLSKKSIFKSLIASTLTAPLTSFLPGLGASQSAVISKQFLRKTNQGEFLFLLGAINTIVMGISFITLYSINKTRTGAAVAINNLIPDLTPSILLIFLTTILISGIISFFIAILISKLIAKNIHKIKYSKISTITLVLLITIIFIFSDNTLNGKIISLIIFITSTALGIFTIQTQIKKMHLMGCLLIPTILYYLL